MVGPSLCRRAGGGGRDRDDGCQRYGRFGCDTHVSVCGEGRHGISPLSVGRARRALCQSVSGLTVVVTAAVASDVTTSLAFEVCSTTAI